MLSGIKVGKRKRKDEVLPGNTNTGSTTASTTTSGTTASSNRHVNIEPRNHLVSVRSNSQSPSQKPAAATSGSSSLSIEEMLREEKQIKSYAEEEQRNMLRLNKHRSKQPKFHDSDEEEQYTLKSASLDLSKTEKSRKSNQKRMNDLAAVAMSKSWWWMESPQFDRRNLLALGNHVSLVMTPPALCLSNKLHGEHFYLVPIAQAESLRQCDADVWNEIRYFQSSLRKLFGTKKKDLLWFETVMHHSKGIWQTKLEGVVVPREVLQDAPLFFQSSLREVVEEGEAHSKSIRIDKQKTLRKSIPANFSYFYVEFDNQEGLCLVIQEKFPRHFALDTVAGMLQMDPVRMKKEERLSHEVERTNLTRFLEEWKKYDWTVVLDE